MEILFIILLLIFSVPCIEKKCHHNSEPNLEFKAELKGSYKLPQIENAFPNDNESIIYYMIEVKLINRSDSIINFITYSCSVIGNIALSSNDVKKCYNRCSGNSPMIIHLKPTQEFSMPIILQSTKSNSNSYINIGWIFLDAKILPDIDLKQTLSNPVNMIQNIIWCNSIYLDSSGGKPFEINAPMVPKY
jgi:hypothetical protein